MTIMSEMDKETEVKTVVPVRRELKGPKGYPLIGNLLSFSALTLHKQVDEWRREFGPIFQCTVLFKKIVFVSNRELIREMCVNEKNSNRVPTFLGQYILPNSIAMTKDKCLSDRLKCVMDLLLVKVMELEGDHSWLHKTIRSYLDRVVDRDCDEVGLDGILRNIFSDFTTIKLIGDTLPDTDPDKNVLWEFIDHLFIMVDPAVDGPLRMFPYLRLLPGYYGNVYRETIAARDRVAKRYFEDQKATFDPGRIRGLVDICLMQQEQEKDRDGQTWLSDEYTKGLIFDTLAAGTDGSPTVHHRPCMPYTEAVRLEVLRFGSQTPLAIPHLCNKDVVVDGYLIPEGTVIFPNLYGVHHDEEVWGDPWVFRPDRFLDEKGELLPSNHKYMENVIPFGVGKRACPGQHFAEARIFIAMTSLLQRMRFMPPENSELPSADPRLYTKKFPLEEPAFDCRVVSRDNIII